LRHSRRQRAAAPAACSALLLGALGAVAGSSRAATCVAPRALSEPTASYAFASELGSGVYDLGGRTLQVYRLPFGYTLRAAAPGRAGRRLILPVTAGIFDYQTQEVLQGVLPSRIDRLSFVPGIELEYLPTPRWSVRPYLQAGVSSASVSSVDAAIFSTGVRADYRWPLGGGDALLGSRLNYTGANYRGCFPADQLVRARSGVEWRRIGGRIGGRALELGTFALFDWFIDPPRSPIAGRRVEPLQGELGVMLGLVPMPSLASIEAPRLGLSYRFAGSLSGWRLVIGAPL
jgi:hypothetical protein